MGFTLIEVLIALTVFSIVMGLAAYSFRFYIGTIQKVVFPYPEEAMAFSRLNEAVEGIFSYVGEKKNIIGKSRFFLYFQGNEREMKFITTKPLVGDSLSVCHLYYQDGRLIWEESPLYGKEDDYKQPDLTSPKKVRVLLKDISDLHFEYYKKGKRLFSGIKNDLPTLIAVYFKKKGEGETNYFFKVKSDFANKKTFMELIHAPF